ncbi:acetamidase/formamidase family protein [Paenibacillus sp. GCM10027629]|uniref:acetamidase/formamidase family protein n=1 Tax=Paenibacillus sp. GCM10027629 TaxID=3273414 RepID=UPI00363E96FB
MNPERSTLHGSFSKEYEPALRINPGDIVRFSCLDMGWALEPWLQPGAPTKRFGPREHPMDSGHALCGPIFINGAEPGMVLKIQINEVLPGSWGWSGAGGYPSEINSRMGVDKGEEYFLHWKLDSNTMTGVSQLGHKIPIRPFMGIMGMPPAEEGIHSTNPPRSCGGNIDCKELVKGSTLYLPISVDGALFSVGDGHAAQGDGEVALPALECPMDLVELEFQLLSDFKLSMPRANTPSGWITFGFNKDLHEATLIALDGMLDLMNELFGYERKESLALASLIVDLRITQIVNGVHGVHAILPHEAVTK